jgi:hypothetical protein
MNCTSATEELRHCARRRTEPEPAVEAHLKHCQACFELWEAERNLSDQLRLIRIAASTRRSSAASRDMLMRKFAEKHQSSAHRRWLWSIAAAAALLLAALLIQSVERRPRPGDSAQTDLQAEAGAQGDFQFQADLQADTQYDGFIAVPYVPPLATGELVSVVHTELYPAALASLGVSVDPAWATELPADLLLGQDGFPRAVRVSTAYPDDRGF